MRIYGREINRWTATREDGSEEIRQVEITFKEYDDNGRLVRSGSEDFSPARLASQTEWRHIYTWDGRRINKGGKRWFEYRGAVRINKGGLQGLKRVKEAEYIGQGVECRTK